MNWEKLTSPDFEKAVRECGRVCIVPMGVVEKHGDHLPLGQDFLYIHRVCSMAAEKETAMVFPPYYLGQIQEGKHVPGTIALARDLLIPVLENICDEICRNGFNKILLVNGHGGNSGMLNYFSMTQLEKKKDYLVYYSEPWFEDKNVTKIKKAKYDGHGGERETSSMLYLFPELVKMNQFKAYGLPIKRFEKFRKAGLNSGIWWYCEYPGHFAASKVPFTAEKGKVFVNARTNYLVKQIKLIKNDETPLKLYQEYMKYTEKPANRYP
jgi:creatinine amidohydrolase